jgi:predicted GNAT family acetyltransferase
MSDVTVTDNPEQGRYEAHLDGELAGIAEYRLSENTVTFTHTEVSDEFEGKGVGSALARGALDDVKAAGDRDVVPLCSFIKGWIDEHPDYAGLVRPAHGGPETRQDG